MLPRPVVRAALAAVFGSVALAVHSAEPPAAPAQAPPAADQATRTAIGPRSHTGAIPPWISARSVAVIDGDSGDVLYDKFAFVPRPPASITKIVTAMVVLERVDPKTRVTVRLKPGEVDPTGTTMGLDDGEILTVEDLLYGLMLVSGNDAALVLARVVAGDQARFAGMMNEWVLRQGLWHTRFVTVDGWDAVGHVTSAHDAGQAARLAMHDARFRTIVAAQSWTVRSQWTYTLRNRNPLLGSYPGTDGVKTGWTDDAGQTYVASVTRNGHRVFVVLLDTKDRAADARALFDWVFRNFRWPGDGLAEASDGS